MTMPIIPAIIAGLALLASQLSAGDPPSLVLPVPDGLHFEAWDHLQSASEPLEFTCRLAGGASAESGLLRYRVVDAAGATVAEGTPGGVVREGDLAVYALLQPAAMAGWAPGWYDLQVAIGLPDGEPAWNSFRFHRIGRAGARQVVYLCDNASPEEYAEWLNGAQREAIEPLKSMPAQPPRLVVVAHWAALPAPTLLAVQDYLAGGGTVLAFGDTTASLDALSPLRLDRLDTCREAPVALRPAVARAGLALDAWTGLTVEAVRADAVADATVLVQCADGRPFLAERAVGRGRMLACAGPLKPGPVYDTLLHGLLGLPAAAAVAPAAAAADGFSAGISQGNIGRFGWNDHDRTDTVGLQADHAWRMWDVPEDTFRVEFGEAGGETLSCSSANWVAKHLVGSGGLYGRRTDIHFGMGMPGALYRQAEASGFGLRIAGPGLVVMPTAAGAVVHRLAVGGELPVQTMDSNWLIICTERQGDGKLWPVLVSVSRKLTALRRSAADRYAFTCDGAGVDVSVMPLLGVGHLDGKIADDARLAGLGKSAAMWSAALGQRIVGCQEDFRLAADGRSVEIRDRYAYLRIADPYGRDSLRIAPLPPLLPLVADQGLVTLPEGAVDTGVATFCGPLHAVLGSDTAVYRLPVPDLSYPLATTPTALPAGDTQAAALLERICEHAMLPRNVYLPVGYGVVDRQPGRPSPTRDLDALTTTKASQEVRGGPFIDLHRNLAGTWGCILLRPYLAAAPGLEAAKAMLSAKIARNLVRDVGFFQYKTFIRYRMEPKGGGRYPVIFLGPVRFGDGHRIFHDLNETASIVAYAFDAWLETGGDEAFARCNLPFLAAATDFMRRCNDWAWMSSMAVEWGMGNNIDMLNSELPCWAALHRLHTRLGDRGQADFAAYMAAKAGVSATARFFMGPFYNRIGFPDLLNITAVTHEMQAMGQVAASAGTFLPFGLANGYGEGWPSLWPNDLGAGYLKHNLIGMDIYNHSKGVCGELPRAYRSKPVQRVLRGFEQAFRAACAKAGQPLLYSRIIGYAVAMDDDSEVRPALAAVMAHPGATAQILGAGTADWEVPSMVLLLDRLVRPGTKP